MRGKEYVASALCFRILQKYRELFLGFGVLFGTCYFKGNPIKVFSFFPLVTSKPRFGGQGKNVKKTPLPRRQFSSLKRSKGLAAFERKRQKESGLWRTIL